jgi:PAS domain S-box-containing protein
MKSAPRLLLLEDDPTDALVLRRSLSAQRFDCELIRTSDKESFVEALNEGGYDLILSDYFIPGFDGLAALAMARERCPEIPFIFVSGAIGDEIAVESLRAGATDYVLKDRPARLVPAIQQALAGAEERTRRKAIEEQHERLVNSVDGIVWEADLPSLRFTFVSRQAERILGYPARCWLEDPGFWQKHIHPEDSARAVSLCVGVSAQEKYKHFEYRMLAANGRVVWLRHIVSLRLEAGQGPGISGIMVDITERKQAEDKIRRIQAELTESNRDLLAKNQEIQNFYHTLSHELKTPLTSAREFISIVMDGVAGGVNETQWEYLGIAKDSCDHMRICIDDLMDATRLETGKMTLELKAATLGPLLQRVITSMVPIAAEKEIALKLELEPELLELPMDENRIAQVLTNLLNNAIKFTPTGGEIMVRAATCAPSPNFVQVSVSDTGRGIAPEDQLRVFDRLYQVKAGDATTKQGVGLGLYLCRELVQLHGGTIWVESRVGEGSTFHFVLPARQRQLRSDLVFFERDTDKPLMRQGLLGTDRCQMRTGVE